MMNLAILLCLLQLLSDQVLTLEGRYLNLGSNLPEYIEKNPDKRWLIKFYAPWCYHCQQLEPIFNNVAEHIYHKYEDLVVGRVDCTKYSSICEKYEVRYYPKIAYLGQNTDTTYNGDRSAESIIEFAERLHGPDILTLNNCQELEVLTKRHKVLVLFVSDKSKVNDQLYDHFKELALQNKAKYWFYEIRIPNCKSYNIHQSGLYIIKSDLENALNYVPTEHENNLNSNDTQEAVIRWIQNSSFPVYGKITSGSIEYTMSQGKTLVIAALDEYKPARKLSRSSREFHESFHNFVKYLVNEQSKKSDQFIFAWTSDTNLLQNLIFGQVPLPNLIIVKPDYSYHLVINTAAELDEVSDKQLPKKLSTSNIKLIMSNLDKLEFFGGDSYLHSILLAVYGKYSDFMNMYRANPLVASILLGLPSLIIAFVVYTTCCQDESKHDFPPADEYSGDEDQYDEQEEQDEEGLSGQEEVTEEEATYSQDDQRLLRNRSSQLRKQN